MAPKKTLRKPAPKAKAVAKKVASKPAPKVDKAKHTEAPKVVPVSSQAVPMAQAQLAAMAHTRGYKGNVPVSSFMGWVVLVFLGVLAVGFLLAQVLVSQRQDQLVDDTAARVALQAQAKAQVVGQWLHGLEGVADAVAQSQLVRLYVSEMGGAGAGDAEMADALRAQTPYMNELAKDFAGRNGAESVFFINRTGNALASFGPMPAPLAANPSVLQQVVAGGKGALLPLRRDGERLVLDVVRPVFSPTQEGLEAPVVGAMWVSLPVGAKLAGLVARTPLDRVGERTALLQQSGERAQVVGQTDVTPLEIDLTTLAGRLETPDTMSLSVVDGKRTFARLHEVAGAPFAVLQEYRAADALALMDLYKPGLYLIVMLAVGVLGALMVALTLHLMAQRNATRVILLGQTMDALVRMVEARDPYLAGHHDKLARIGLQMANELHLPVGERATLFYAAKLSAVGRLLVPRDLLAKKGKLTAAERKELEEHIARAQTVLGELEFDLPVVPVIQQMYERYDGSGYPSGLKGDEIHRMARVLGAADAFMAMTSARAHRDAMGKDMALEVMQASKHYDQQILAVLRRVAGA